MAVQQVVVYFDCCTWAQWSRYRRLNGTCCFINFWFSGRETVWPSVNNSESQWCCTLRAIDSVICNGEPSAVTYRVSRNKSHEVNNTYCLPARIQAIAALLTALIYLFFLPDPTCQMPDDSQSTNPNNSDLTQLIQSVPCSQLDDTKCRIFLNQFFFTFLHAKYISL